MFSKTTKTLVAAVALAAATVTFVANSYAAPSQNSPSNGERTWMDRASNPYQGESGGQ